MGIPSRRNHPGMSADPDESLIGLWPLVATTAAAVGITVATSMGVSPLVIGIAVSVAGLGLVALLGGGLPTFALIVTALSTVGLWHYFEAYELRPVVGVVITIMVVVLLLSTRRHGMNWRSPDVGAAFVVLALCVPALISREIQPLLGTVTIFAGTYLVARLAGVPRPTVLTVALWIGAGHGLAAVIALILGIDRLLPVSDEVQSALVTGRGTGLYLNPNTLGNVEAMVVVLALWWGIPRRHLPLLILVVAGLALSGSREAVLGAGVATLAISLVHPWRVALFTFIGGTIFFATFLLLPEIALRFDPRILTVDPSYGDRLLSWDQALEVIGFSPVFGHGLKTSFVIDQAYLVWLVRGGIVGAFMWMVGLGLLTISSRVWPVVVAMALGGFLADTFSGAPLLLLLLIAGVSAGASSVPDKVSGASEMGGSRLETRTKLS